MRTPGKISLQSRNLQYNNTNTRMRLAYKITKTIALKELHQRAHQIGAQVTIANTVDILPPQRPYER